MAKYLTPSQAAKFLSVSPITLRSWVNKGLLKAATTAGGHRRYSEKELKRFALKNGIEFESEETNEIRILIVDDENSFAEMLSSYLELKLEKAITHVTNTGFEAGQLLHTFSPSVILLDLNMPDINGCEVCKLVKENSATRHIKVIVMTGMFTEDSVKNAMECGADHCVSKPIDIDKLIKLIA